VQHRGRSLAMATVSRGVPEQANVVDECQKCMMIRGERGVWLNNYEAHPLAAAIGVNTHRPAPRIQVVFIAVGPDLVVFQLVSAPTAPCNAPGSDHLSPIWLPKILFRTQQCRVRWSASEAEFCVIFLRHISCG
jgi:hypothetical protein